MWVLDDLACKVTAECCPQGVRMSAFPNESAFIGVHRRLLGFAS
jgi:hypothetical protein